MSEYKPLDESKEGPSPDGEKRDDQDIWDLVGNTACLIAIDSAFPLVNDWARTDSECNAAFSLLKMRRMIEQNTYDRLKAKSMRPSDEIKLFGLQESHDAAFDAAHYIPELAECQERT